MSHRQNFLRLVEPFKAPLASFCHKSLYRNDDLEDALQEILIVSFSKFSDFEPGTHFKAWIFKTATFVCLNFNRRHLRTPVLSFAEDVANFEEKLEREFTYDEILKNPSAIYDEFDDEVLRICGRLTEKERSILLLKSIAGLTCREIAEILDIPVGTSQGLLTRARMKMREGLSEYARSKGIFNRKEKFHEM